MTTAELCKFAQDNDVTIYISDAKYMHNAVWCAVSTDRLETGFHPVDSTFVLDLDLLNDPNMLEIAFDAQLQEAAKKIKEEIQMDDNKKIMTPEEFADEMRKIQEFYIDKKDDQELAHVNADDIMCHLLSQLGYKKGIDIFYGMPKWYA